MTYGGVCVKQITSHWSERVPQDTFSGSIVLRSSNWFGGKLLSFGGTRRSILRYTDIKTGEPDILRTSISLFAGRLKKK